MEMRENSDNGGTRGYNALAAAGLAPHGVPAGRYDSEIRAIGLERLISGKRLRKSDIVERHVVEHARFLQRLDEYTAALSEKGHIIVEASVELMNAFKPSACCVERVNYDFMQRKHIWWLGLNTQYLNATYRGELTPELEERYAAACRDFQNDLAAYEALHGIEAIRQFRARFESLRRDIQ